MKKYLLLLSLFATLKSFANTPPYIDPTSLAPRTVCAEGTVTVFDDLRILDDDGDALTILGVTTPSGEVFTNSSFSYTVSPEGMGVNSIAIYGSPFQAGTTNLHIQLTDGTNNVTLITGSVSAVYTDEPIFLTDTIALCANAGAVNLYQYVNISGGTFSNSWSEETYYDGIFDPAASSMAYDQYNSLDYWIDGVCSYSIETVFILREGPTPTSEYSNPDCGMSNGSATVFFSGGVSPYIVSWNNGVQNENFIHDIPAGMYVATVTDSVGCIATVNIPLSSAGIEFGASTTDPVCFGQSNGAIDLEIFGMTAPYNIFWSSGQTSLQIDNLPQGNYTATVSDANGCVVIADVALTQPDELLTEVNTTLPDCGDSNGAIDVESTSGGTSPYQYSWSTGDTGTGISNLGAAIYSLTTTDDHGCTAITPVYLSENNAASVELNSITPASCGASDGSMDVYVALQSGQTVQQISWSNGAATEDIANVAAGNYVCTLVTDDGCTSIKGWAVPVVTPQLQPICVVTVDSATTTNLVVWEPVQTTGIAWYNIYRETSVPNDFMLIDTVHGDNHSVFNDVVASPQQQWWKYKISAVNACGAESALSSFHQTIHLDAVAGGGNSTAVLWNPYIGTAFSSYRLSRYTDANGWEEIAQLPATQLKYIDLTDISTPGLDYLVEFDLGEPCNALRANDFNSSRSNKDKGNFVAGNGTGVSNNSLAESYLNNITIYPNPVRSELQVSQEGNEQLTVTVMTVTGVLVGKKVISQAVGQIDMSALSSGVYLLKIEYAGKQRNERIIRN